MKIKPIHESLDSNHQFKIYGYKIYRNGSNDFLSLKKSFCAYFKNKMEEFGRGSVANFSLGDYHIHLDQLGLEHHEFIKAVGRTVPIEFLDMSYINSLIKMASKDLDNDFKIYEAKVEFRVVRPNNDDNNDPHRDHWFPYFTPLVNIYIPLSNSYYDSAMGIVPFSHEWPDEDVVPTFTYEDTLAGKKYVKNGVSYSVPTVKTSVKEFTLHRPDLIEGDFMLFSPKLIHGGGTNSSMGTRFSFEIRLEPRCG